jgi:hydroxyacylglutathione hydrolase
VRRLAEDVYLLRGFPRNAVNVYLVGDVLMDAGTRFASRRVLAQVRGRAVNVHALTHAHPDHRGSSHEVCKTLAVPLWCGASDVATVQGTAAPTGSGLTVRATALIERVWAGPPHPVARPLREGDQLAGFTVLEVPGHSPGHVAFWRAADRILILGDVLFNLNPLTAVPGLHEPPRALSSDPAVNRESARRLAGLRPALACFGHGPPLREPDRLEAFVAGLR